MKYLAIFIFISNFYIPTDYGDNPFKSKKLYKTFIKQYPYIPSGSLILENKEEVSVQGFYMYNHEVTNEEYRKYLKATDQKISLYKSGMNEAEKNQINYLFHPSYDEYPAYNMTHTEALQYCEWLKKEITNRYELPTDKIEVRLPTKTEWTYAGKGGHTMAPYAWGGYYIRNAKGCHLANFNHSIDSGNITLNQDTGEYEIVHSDRLNPNSSMTTLAVSYFPNDYGLYNMCGNVAEMIYEEGLAMGGSYNSTGYDIRLTSQMRYDKKSPEVGFRPIIIIK